MLVIILKHDPSTYGYAHWDLHEVDLELDGFDMAGEGCSVAGMETFEELWDDVMPCIKDIPPDRVLIADFLDDSAGFDHTPDEDIGSLIKARLVNLTQFRTKRGLH